MWVFIKCFNKDQSAVQRKKRNKNKTEEKMEEEPSRGYRGNEKRCVLRSFLKVWTDEGFLMLTGILFHSLRPAMEKALSPVLCEEPIHTMKERTSSCHG